MDDKKKINYKTWILLVIGLAVGLLAAKYLFNNFGGNKSPLDKELVEATKEINKHLPMMIDSETRTDSTVVLPYNTIQYVFTMINQSKDQLNAEDFEKRLRPLILNSIKTNSDMENFRKNEVTLVYLYKDKDGKEFLKFTFKYDDYKE